MLFNRIRIILNVRVRDSRRFLFILVSICCFSLFACLKSNIEYSDDLIRFHMIITSCYVLQQWAMLDWNYDLRECTFELLLPFSLHRMADWMERELFQSSTVNGETDDSILFLATIATSRMGGSQLQCCMAVLFVNALYLFYYNQIICLVIQNKYGQGINVCACTRNKTPTHWVHSNEILYVKMCFILSVSIWVIRLQQRKKEKTCSSNCSFA